MNLGLGKTHGCDSNDNNSHFLDKYYVSTVLSSAPAEPHLLPSEAGYGKQCYSHSGDEGLEAETLSNLSTVTQPESGGAAI